MIKARMLVEGVLQGVGYRAIVKQAARFSGVKGLVRNLDDGRAEIFCEGSKISMGKFRKLIEMKGKPEDIMSINVTKIEYFEEGQKGYSPAWKPYRGFEIDYGVEKLPLFEESTLEDHEFGKLYFSSFRNELKSFREESNVSFGQMAEKFGGMSAELKEFRKDTNMNFAQMAEKYGDISTELKEFRRGIERFLTQFLKEYSKKRKQP